jgi:hypothetical protein
LASHLAQTHLLFPWFDRPSLPLELNDAIPVFLSASAFAGLIFLAVLSSTTFAFLLAALVLLNAIFRHTLEAPTIAGRKVLAEPEGFREDQIGKTPVTFEKNPAPALARDVEHAWGEEFLDNLLELLELDQACTRRSKEALPSTTTQLS